VTFYSVPDVDASDEAAVTSRMAELIRTHNLSCVELSDDTDENGNVQVKFYGSDEAVASAAAEVLGNE
jgi:hypothetical protein